MEHSQKVTAIIQARMGATRLPGKVLGKISGRPMLWHVINRVNKATLVNEVIVATSTMYDDDIIADFCNQNGIVCFRGSLNDVLDRFYLAARSIQGEVLVRITADCPLIDHQVIDKVIGVYLEGNYDYVTNTLRHTYPDGMDTEVFSFSALEETWREAQLTTEREHVTPYMRTSGRFRIKNVECYPDLSSLDLRFTVDEERDLDLVRAIYEMLEAKGSYFGLADILTLLKEEPTLVELNKDIIRNEGYYKSLVKEPPIEPKKRILTQSFELRERARRVIPSCSQTFSKGPTQFVQGVSPVFIARGQGSRVWDVDDNEYIDYAMALGPIILGHNHPNVTEAVTRQIQDGTTFTLPHPLEVEVSEKLIELIPCAEMVRFCKNGSDATTGAVRVARAYTGRDIIACCGYHGWHDWYIGTTTRNEGVPRAVQELTKSFQYNNIDTLKDIFRQHTGNVAAVVLEPVGVIEPQNSFLEEIKALTSQEGALLIFDEIVTGFRLSLGGAQEYFGITPDLACFGKAIANGLPLASVVGRREVMKLFDEVFFSFTFGGETLSLAAAKATVETIMELNVIENLWEKGRKLKDGYNILAREFSLDHHTQCIGFPPRTVITFKNEAGEDSLTLKSLFQQECLKREVLFTGAHNLCSSHTDADIEYTLRVYRTTLEILAEAIATGNEVSRLEGDAVQPVFRHA